jgi:nascent polypeptide-associated complex subunit alpha
MIPNMGGLDPRKISSMMKQMGITNNELPATKVIIELQDGKILIIENPGVTEITMSGQKSYQVTGDVTEEKKLIVSSEDIDLVVSSTKVSKEKAKKLLEETDGDIAKAISLASN